MTKPKLVFNPVSQDYFDNQYEIYERMREEAPVYYDEVEDFYALTRHADVAAAFKDYESFSSARGCDLSMVRTGEVPQKSIIFMDPPDHRHMRSLLNKAFTPRAIQSQRETVIELVEHYLSKADPDHFDVVQDFSGPFPVEVITRMAGVPEEFRQQVRHWIDTSLQRDPGQIDLSEANMQANIDSAVYYYGLVQERRENPQDDMINRLIAAEVPGENGELRKLDDIEITGFLTLLGGAGAETVTKLVGSAVVEFARHPEQWQKLLDDRSKIPDAVEELLRYVGPVNTTSATASRTSNCPAASSRPTNRSSSWVPPRTVIPARSRTRRRSTSPATAARRRTSGSATASTVASVPRWPAWRARSRSSACSTSCLATRSTSTAWNACTCRTSPATTMCP